MQAVAKEIRGLLKELSRLEVLKGHYLAGGTNLALRYGHRTSIDLDFFIQRGMVLDDSNYLNLKLREIFGSRFESNSVTKVGVFGFIDNIKVDFVNYPYPLLYPIENIDGARLANALDIAGMKVNAIIGRGTRKDFFDLNRLLEAYPMESIMKSYKEKYGLDNTQQASMALAYFGDAEDVKLRDNKYVSFMEITWEQIKQNITWSMRDFESREIVRLAIDFHCSEDYPNKIPNIKAYFPNGALSKAFQERFGIRLTKDQIDMIDEGIERKMGRGYGYKM